MNKPSWEINYPAKSVRNFEASSYTNKSDANTSQSEVSSSQWR
jgi:hypothetical protein